MPSSQTPFAAIFRCLSGIKQCIALAGLLTLALTVVAWKGLAGRKHLLVPAGLVSLALTVLILVRLARYRLRAALAGSLLLALVAVSAGTTLGDDDPYLKAFPGDGSTGEYNDQGHLLLEIRPGMTVTYIIEFVGNPADHPNINCGDYLSVHIYGGGVLTYLEIENYSLGYDTDPNDDNCSDGRWDSQGNTATVTVADDAPGNVSTGISYEVEKIVEGQFIRKIGPRTVVRFVVNDVTPLMLHLRPHRHLLQRPRRRPLLRPHRHQRRRPHRHQRRRPHRHQRRRLLQRPHLLLRPHRHLRLLQLPRLLLSQRNKIQAPRQNRILTLAPAMTLIPDRIRVSDRVLHPALLRIPVWAPVHPLAVRTRQLRLKMPSSVAQLPLRPSKCIAIVFKSTVTTTCLRQTWISALAGYPWTAAYTWYLASFATNRSARRILYCVTKATTASYVAGSRPTAHLCI